MNPAPATSPAAATVLSKAVVRAARLMGFTQRDSARILGVSGASRFRAVADAGVFYGADIVRNACAELGCRRWRHLADSPALEAMPTKPQTLFRARITTPVIDPRATLWSARRALLEQQTWMLSVTRKRVVWQRTGVLRDETLEFPASGRQVSRRAPAPRRAKRRSGR